MPTKSIPVNANTLTGKAQSLGRFPYSNLQQNIFLQGLPGMSPEPQENSV